MKFNKFIVIILVTLFLQTSIFSLSVPSLSAPVVDNAKFTVPSTSNIKAGVSIQTGKQMTIDTNVKFVAGSTINVAQDASLKGDKCDATITNNY